MGRDCFVRCRMCRNTLVSLHWAVRTLLQLWQSKCHRFWHVPLGQCHTSPTSRWKSWLCCDLSKPFIWEFCKNQYCFCLSSWARVIFPRKEYPFSSPTAHTELLISWEPVGKGTLRASILSTNRLLFARLKSLSWHRRGQKLNHALTFALYLEEHTAPGLTPQPLGHTGISDSCSWGPGPAQLVHFVLFRI